MLQRPGSLVWGVLWELDISHSETLDRQEGLPTVYNKKTVDVTLEDGSSQVKKSKGLPRNDQLLQVGQRRYQKGRV